MKNINWNKVTLIIPSYKPSDSLLIQVSNLQRKGFSNILIVNDGSPANYQIIFEQLKDVTILTNEINQGKGSALKLAYRYALENFKECEFAICCDDDGQHHPDDVLKIATEGLSSSVEQTYLGVRTFGKDVPIKSILGNIIIRKMLHLVTRKYVSDTQTGLRCMPMSLLPVIVEISYDNFNFEFATLLYLIKNKLPIKEIPIRTIYFNKNQDTRFRSFQDSWKVVSSFFGYFS
jgi:glycosyltransferase involved in cell wall biosynthesis